MSNMLVFNDPKSPLITIAQVVVSQSLIGQAFQSAATMSGSSTTMAMLLSNPSSSGIRAVVDSMVISVNSTSIANRFHMRFNPTMTGLSAVSIFNLNTSPNPTALCTATAGGNVTISGAGSIIHREFLNVSSHYYPLAAVLTPGNSFDVDYLFPGSNVGTVVLRWYEIPLSGFSD